MPSREKRSRLHTNTMSNSRGERVHHGFELQSVLLALGPRLAVFVLRDDTPVHGLSERQQLLALILRGLFAPILRSLG
jgi:hypothetical protein